MPERADAIEFDAADLAPGDQRGAQFDRATIWVDRIGRPDHWLLRAGYQKLWDEFGAAGEVEQFGVLERRLAASAAPGAPRRYEMLVVRRAGGDDGGAVVAVRDHQAIVSAAAPAAGDAGAVVHLSHAWVHPEFRRTGLAGWLRAWPVQTARSLLRDRGGADGPPITLVAEMEHPDERQPARMIRLAAYEKAGFLKVDPAALDYHQPDFRPPAEIDASGGVRPIPFGLVVRRVNRERELTITGRELRSLVSSLYRIYASDFREQDMRPMWDRLAREAPPDDAIVALVPPTRKTDPEPTT